MTEHTHGLNIVITVVYGVNLCQCSILKLGYIVSQVIETKKPLRDWM